MGGETDKSLIFTKIVFFGVFLILGIGSFQYLTRHLAVGHPYYIDSDIDYPGEFNKYGLIESYIDSLETHIESLYDKLSPEPVCLEYEIVEKYNVEYTVYIRVDEIGTEYNESDYDTAIKITPYNGSICVKWEE